MPKIYVKSVIFHENEIVRIVPPFFTSYWPRVINAGIWMTNAWNQAKK